ncbi:motilin-like [Stigmatopora argus]
MSMRGAVACCLVLTCLVALLVERTQGHMTFFSPQELSEMRLLKQREGRKDMAPRSEDGQCQEVAVQKLPQTEHDGELVRVQEWTHVIQDVHFLCVCV